MEISERNGHVLSFNDKAHKYTLDGKPITGVTTLNKRGYPESLHLINWKIGQGVRYAINEAKKTKRLTQKKIDEIIKSSKKAYLKALDEAADIGTIVHDYAYCKEKGLQFDQAKIDQHPDSVKIKKCIEAFTEWESVNQDEVIASEELVACVDDWFAGKFDRLVNRNGLTILDDFKTSSFIYPGHFIQLAGYKIAIEDWLGIKVDGLEVIRFGKDGSFETKIVTDKNEIKDYTEQFYRNLGTANFIKRYEK